MADGETTARARLEALFTTFNRLTPDELGHIGLLRDDGPARSALLATVEAAARRADRSALLGEARTEARDVVMRRYAEGSLHPTWVGLNWGLSQGTTEDRVAIVEALADAAAAAVVEDLVDPSVTEALALDAGHILALAIGEASEGSLAHAIEPPPAGFRDTPGRRIAVVVGDAAPVELVGLAPAGSLGSALLRAQAAGRSWHRSSTRLRAPPRRCTPWRCSSSTGTAW